MQLYAHKRIPIYAAPCGIYCKACECFEKTCTGCRSDKPQKRISKLNCHIRRCIVNRSNNFCVQCIDYPCKSYRLKFMTLHNKDARYRYRRDAVIDSKIIINQGLSAWDRLQNKKWTCPNCGGQISFFSYKCQKCHQIWLSI